MNKPNFCDVELKRAIFQSVGLALKEHGFPEKKTDEFYLLKRTEKILRTYPRLKEVLQEKRGFIEELRKYPYGTARNGIAQGSIVRDGIMDNSPSILEVIDGLENDAKYLERVILRINAALEAAKSSEHYSILELYYFEGHTRDTLSAVYSVTKRTIDNWRKDLLRKVAQHLFTDDFLLQFLA